jgi:hypothetical protein
MRAALFVLLFCFAASVSATSISSDDGGLIESENQHVSETVLPSGALGSLEGIIFKPMFPLVKMCGFLCFLACLWCYRGMGAVSFLLNTMLAMGHPFVFS